MVLYEKQFNFRRVFRYSIVKKQSHLLNITNEEIL